MRSGDESDFTEREALILRGFLKREGERRAARVPPGVAPIVSRARRPTVGSVVIGMSVVTLTAAGTIALIAATLGRPIDSAATQRPAAGLASPSAPAVCALSVPRIGDDGLRLFGSGPVTLSIAAADGTAYFERPATARWSAIETIWTADPGFEGPVSVRGRQIDGQAELRFGDPNDPVQELRLVRGDSSALVAGRSILGTSEIRVQASGCYAVTIDAGGSATTVVFRAAPISDAFLTLERPLNLPQIPTVCSPSPMSIATDYVGDLYGVGPVYMTGGTAMSIADATRLGAFWLFQQTWLVSDTELGPVLIRGARVDGTAELRFGAGGEPTSELRLPIRSYEHTPGQPPGWRMFNQYLRPPGVGCYALQIDTLSSTETIVVRVDP
ncbi:MAG: hypothetical protein QOD50_2036 [Actinomycetota bacterium]|nr:hypothetical protein [Actinomycetota bacterium]